MLVTLSGMVIEESEVHPPNTLLAILVTLSGIVIDVSEVHPLNA